MSSDPARQGRPSAADYRRYEAALATARRTSVLVTLAIGLVLLLATTWLVPAGTDSQAVHDFAGARTGLGMLDGPWQSTEPARQWIGTIGIVGYVVAACAVAIAAGRTRWLPLLAAWVGLVATVGVLATKPGDLGPDDWSYSWQSPPFVACAFWLVLIGLTAPDARNRSVPSEVSARGR